MTLPGIVIPVFNAYEHLVACLHSLDNCSPHAQVLVVDDASTDSRVQPLLHSWTNSRDQREILTNNSNQGFVYSANRGMGHCKGDVILLNSDTVVTPGWLESIAACLGSDDAIATATPWSNNGEIVSFPDFCAVNPIPQDLPQLAAAIKSAGEPEYPGLPTAVGFCMAISRRAIEVIGLFDQKTFGRGYGEENDFSRRVAQAAMRNVLCDNAYVAHTGGASFGPVGLKPDRDSMNRLLDKHPDYEAIVQTFIQEDPLAERRTFLINAVRRAGVPIG